MIGRAIHLREYYKVELSVSDEQINAAILTANMQLAGMIGAAHFIEIDTTTEQGIQDGDTIVIAGVSHPFTGFNTLVEAGAVAALIHSQDVVITSFGIVRKTDEYSEHADTFAPAKQHEHIFRSGVAYFCGLKGWDYHTPDTTPTTTRFFAQ